MQIPTPDSGDLSLYFHLPFCQKKCDYCNFYVIPNRDSLKNLLLKALLKEIHLKKAHLKSKSIVSVYFGGGTPSLVGPQFIETVLREISQHVSLEHSEITLEVNPENHNLELLKGYNNAGINRLSFGAQTFDDHLLKMLNRSHSAKDIYAAINIGASAGFENISCDLMYDLPSQTLENWLFDLKQIQTLPLSHLSLYNLSIEPNTVFFKRKESIRKVQPSPEIALEMLQQAIHTFQDWQHYEISAFCKKERYSHHNVGYWLQREHLGFGPSAFSLLGKKRFQNIANISKYEKQMNQHDHTPHFKEQLDDLPFLKESLALHLRLLQGFNLTYFENRFGPLPDDLLQKISKLVDDKMLIMDHQCLKLSSKGLYFHDSIASDLI